MPAAGRILCLDLATVSGFAHGMLDGRPVGGALRLGRGEATHAERYARMFKWLWEFIAVERPAEVIYEAPLPPSFARGKTNIDTAAFLMGLPAVVETACQLRGVHRVSKVAVHDVRASFIGGRGFLYKGKPLTGRRNLPRDEAKFCVGERCRQLGHTPSTNDEADALAIFYHVAAVRRPGQAWALAPLAEASAA